MINRFAVLLLLAFLGGCSARTPKQLGVAALFDVAFADYQKSGEPSPVQSVSAESHILLMPASVSELVNKGQVALPDVRRFDDGSTSQRSQFAKACVELLTEQDIEAGERFQSGNVEMIVYTVIPGH